MAARPDNPYTPPTCVPGVPFIDITCTTGFDPWIEQFGLDGISAGCGGGKYCPSTLVTRDQMAVFIEKAMRGTSNWTPGDLGNGNTGLGGSSLYANTTGGSNTGLGYGSLVTNTMGSANTGVGYGSLFWNTEGSANTGLGYDSLVTNTIGSFNTGLGHYSLYSNTTGDGNTGLGNSTLYSNTTGSNNTAIGELADVGSGNLTNATAIGYQATVNVSNRVRIGSNTVTHIGGQVGWTNESDIRAKSNIADLDLGLDFVMRLHPVSFTMKQGNGRTDMGFIAQDMEALLGDGYNVLGIDGDKDRTLSLRYTDFIAPMVKAIQEQQAQITDQAKTIQAQQAQIGNRDARIAALEVRLAAIEARLTGK